MRTRSTPAAAKAVAKSRTLPRTPARTAAKTLPKRPKPAVLPEWNLTDLYPALDAPEVKRDLDRVDADCRAFEASYKGRLADMARAVAAGAALAEVVRRYETIRDVIGRLMSFARLTLAGDTTDPVRAKFYGDVHERITAASAHLLFFTLELNPHRQRFNRCRDGGPRTRPLPAVDRGCPQGKALSARGPHRAALP